MATYDFLKDYQNVLLRHVIIPGSHDAGLAAASFEKLGGRVFSGSSGSTVTQSVGVGEQANRGSRFFDVRIQLVGGQLKSYHSWMDKRSFGGTGQGFESILNELRDFVRSKPSEFVIVRLAHLKDPAPMFKALMVWMQTNDAYICKETGNLATKFVYELAGKIIFLIEGSALVAGNFESKKVPGQSQGFHKLYQNKKNSPLPSVRDGLCICGEFSQSKKLEKIVAGQISNYTAHDKHRVHGNDDLHHLYCLYWTSTGGNIEENTKQLSSNFQRVRALVAKMGAGTAKHCLEKNIPIVNAKEWSTAISIEDRARLQYAVYSCSLPNIILYDFVNENISKQIIGLNCLTLCQT